MHDEELFRKFDYFDFQKTAAVIAAVRYGSRGFYGGGKTPFLDFLKR